MEEPPSPTPPSPGRKALISSDVHASAVPERTGTESLLLCCLSRKKGEKKTHSHEGSFTSNYELEAVHGEWI